MKENKLKNFLEYLQDKVQDCYKEETRIAIERFLKEDQLRNKEEIEKENAMLDYFEEEQ